MTKQRMLRNALPHYGLAACRYKCACDSSDKIIEVLPLLDTAQTVLAHTCYNRATASKDRCFAFPVLLQVHGACNASLTWSLWRRTQNCPAEPYQISGEQTVGSNTAISQATSHLMCTPFCLHLFFFSAYLNSSNVLAVSMLMS